MSDSAAARFPRAKLIGRSLWHFFVHDVCVALLAVLVAGVVWWLVTRVVDSSWLPTPTSVVRESVHLLKDHGFRSAFLTSIREAAIGFGIATVIGGLVGFFMGLFRVAEDGLRWYLDLLLVVPPAALAPMLIVIVGLSSSLTIIMSSIFAISVIAISTAAAVKEVDRSLLEVGRVFGTRGRLGLVRTVLIPAMSPQFFSGLHLGMARAMKGMIVGQVVVGIIGIGEYEAQFQQVFDSVGVWSIAVLLVGASLAMTWIVKAIDSFVNHWAYRT